MNDTKIGLGDRLVGRWEYIPGVQGGCVPMIALNAHLRSRLAYISTYVQQALRKTLQP